MDLIPGTDYKIRLSSGNWVPATYIGVLIRGYKRKMTHYQFKNKLSNREVVIKSTIRIKNLK